MITSGTTYPQNGGRPDTNEPDELRNGTTLAPACGRSRSTGQPGHGSASLEWDVEGPAPVGGDRVGEPAEHARRGSCGTWPR